VPSSAAPFAPPHSSPRDGGELRSLRPAPSVPVVPSVSGPLRSLFFPPVAPDSSVAPPSRSPLPASPSWHALSSSCLWPPQVSASRAALACPALPPLRRGEAARRSSLLLVSPDDCSPADSPHFLWPFAVRYAAHQLNLWPRVSLAETSPTLRWTGEVGDASVFRFHHPTSRRVFPSQDVTFDKSVPFYRLFPYRSSPPPPPPLFLTPGPPPIDPLLPQGPAPSGVSQLDHLHGPAPVQVAFDSGAARGAASGGAGPGGAES
ncbi:unnamed protein product, partial [Closterium sp. NIES-53]